MAGNRTGSHHLAPFMRKTVLRALQTVAERENKSLTEVMADWIQADPVKMMTAIGKFAEKTNVLEGKVDVDHNHTHSHTLTPERVQSVNDFLGQFAAPDSDTDHEASGEDRPVLVN